MITHLTCDRCKKTYKWAGAAHPFPEVRQMIVRPPGKMGEVIDHGGERPKNGSLEECYRCRLNRPLRV